MKTMCVSMALLLPALAWAQPRAQVGGFVDLYFVPSAELELSIPGFGSADDDGDGFGIRSMAPVADVLFLAAEYQSVEYDDSNLEFDQLRFGVGLGDIQGASVRLEYIDVDSDGESSDGFGVHARMAGALSDALGLYGQIGYISVDDDFEDFDGIEFAFGLAGQLAPNFGAFVDYRVTNLEGDQSNDELELADLRIGVRMMF